MAKKKIVKKTPKKSVPKKKPAKKISEEKPKVKLISTKHGLVEVKQKPETDKKKDNRKYVKVYDNDPPEKRKEIGDRLYRKEIRFAYYASEGSHGVWYYLIL